MSIPVAVADLARALADFDAGYLLSTGGDGRVKAVSVAPSLVDGVLHVVGPGRGSCANVSANPVVTLLYPPRTPGFSLLVDGTATVAGPDGLDLEVSPTSAVLHKPVS